MTNAGLSKAEAASAWSTGPADVGAALWDTGFLEADPRKGGDTFANRVFRRQRETEPQVGFARLRIARPFGARVENNSGLGGGRQQLCHIDMVRKLEPEENSALRLPHFLDGGAEFALDGFDHRVELVVEGLGEAPDMAAEIPRKVFRHDHLIERAGATVGLSLARDKPAHSFWDGNDIAEAQRRRQGLRERADVDDLLRIHRIQGRRARTVPGQIGIAFVFKDRDIMLSRQGEQLLAAFARQDRTGRVLDRRDRIDVFRNDTLALQVLDDPAKSLDLQPFVVERRADNVGPEALELGQGAAIGEFFKDD